MHMSTTTSAYTHGLSESPDTCRNTGTTATCCTCSPTTSSPRSSRATILFFCNTSRAMPTATCQGACTQSKRQSPPPPPPLSADPSPTLGLRRRHAPKYKKSARAGVDRGPPAPSRGAALRRLLCVMAEIVMAYSYGLHGHGLCSYGLHSFGLHSYGLYRCCRASRTSCSR